jgi:beta-galactosidase/beta-glucuronidase
MGAADEGEILVPFPVESELSGVRRKLGESEVLRYRRGFKVPADWQGKRVHLNFGAVDWQAQVFVNGKFVGRHRGGYDGFSFDVTDAISREGENELVVEVTDPTEGDQPRGKQSRKPEGIFYTASSGIWQTVWLEPVPEWHVSGVYLTPDFTNGTMRAVVMASTPGGVGQVEVKAWIAGGEAGGARGEAGREVRVALSPARFWSPEKPELYDVEVTLFREGAVADRVRSYFGLREVRLGTDERGARRIFLNGKPVFLTGVLDQGFWPDGLYTAPSDEALKFDLETAKGLGFNLVRKHVKVEPGRWYYWADRLGMLVWQDMPSGNNATEEGRRQFEAELNRMVDQRSHHPSILMWVLFNEGWGQFETERLVKRLKAGDPTRLVSNASGWTDMKAGDVVDLHSYPNPVCPAPEPYRAGVLGEFGGLGLGVTNHTWSEQRPWGYQDVPDAERLTDLYGELLERVWGLQWSNGLAAAVYTQLTDVETECNGFLTYDREVLKMDAKRVRFANQRPPMLVPDGRYGAFEWRYSTSEPAGKWQEREYGDEAWKRGMGGFGTRKSPGVIVRTGWESAEIWVRREFELAERFKEPSAMVLYHDEDAEVYLNGVLALKVTGYVTSYRIFDIAPEARKTLRAGRNVLAIHCRQTNGGQYLDAGIVGE